MAATSAMTLRLSALGEMLVTVRPNAIKDLPLDLARQNQHVLGVSTAFRIYFPYCRAVYLEFMVIPRSFSRALLSMKRSWADACPQCASSLSMSVVLP